MDWKSLEFIKWYSILQFHASSRLVRLSDARRDGDRDANKAIIADTMKLVSAVEVISYVFFSKIVNTRSFCKNVNLALFWLLLLFFFLSFRLVTPAMEKPSQTKSVTEKWGSVRKQRPPERLTLRSLGKLSRLTRRHTRFKVVRKQAIKLNLPLQIEFFAYQYAKLRMLQFYFDFHDKYLDRSDFQYCEMDTDSAYIAISGPSVEKLVKAELKDKPNWFP